jgi:hypothetical protein
VIREPRVAPRLAAFLQHPDVATREHAIETVVLLGDRCPEDLRQAMRQQARQETDPKLRQLATMVVRGFPAAPADGP